MFHTKRQLESTTSLVIDAGAMIKVLRVVYKLWCV